MDGADFYHIILRIVGKLRLQLLAQHNDCFVHKMVRNLVVVLYDILRATTAAGIANLVFKELCQTVCQLTFVIVAGVVLE